MELEHAALRALLPHRHPMILLDRVEAVVPGESLRAVKAISGCEPCYRDAPPDADTDWYAYPFSLLLESFGQAAAVLWLLGAPHEHGLPMFAAAKDCRPLAPVRPGDVVVHHVELEQTVHGAAFATGTSWVGRTRVAEYVQLMAVVRPVELVRETRLDVVERSRT